MELEKENPNEAKPLQPKSNNKVDRRAEVWKRFASWCVPLLCIIVVIYGILLLKDDAVGVPLLNCTPSTQQFKHGSKLNYTRRELVPLDVRKPPYYPISESIGIAESLLACHYEWNVTGTLKLARGDPEQTSSFLVGVDVAADSQMALDSVNWPLDDDATGISVRCVDFPGITDVWDATVEVDVTVFVKPGTLQFGHFRVRTDVLDIEISDGLEFETYHFDLFSDNGDIVSVETEKFTGHSTSVFTFNGSITGNWSLPGSIEFRRERNPALESFRKPIDINLIPKRWSAGPTTAGRVLAVSELGDVRIRMPFMKESLSLRNTSIDIRAEDGDVSGALVVGSWTSITVREGGSINATLLPFFALSETANIATSTVDGETDLTVFPPVIHDYWKINPLSNSRSEHTTTAGSMSLHYPPQWSGTALGLTEDGNVSIAGSSFSTIIKREGFVVGRTGDELASRITFETETGDGILVVE